MRRSRQTTLLAASRSARQHHARADAASCASAVADAAEGGVEATQGMRGAAGRAGNVSADALAGVPDAGAHAVAVWCRAIATSLASADEL